RRKSSSRIRSTRRRGTSSRGSWKIETEPISTVPEGLWISGCYKSISELEKNNAQEKKSPRAAGAHRRAGGHRMYARRGRLRRRRGRGRGHEPLLRHGLVAAAASHRHRP